MHDSLIIVFLGGIFGAVLMDITETVLARHGISSGVTVALVGRWTLALARGTLVHRDIRLSPPRRREVIAGWLFHLLVGGGAVALLLPIAGQLISTTELPGGVLAYLSFGLATSVLPWFILLPSFGWGWFGRHGPVGSNALLASPLSHLPYGLGIWLTVTLFVD